MAAEASTLLGIEHYIYRTDGRVYVRRVGDGEPIIFLHSVSSHAKAWAYMVERLARRFTCYTIDMPGHDHSDIPPRKYTMEDYADSILEVIETIGLEKTDVVGDHTGSIIALILAAKYPKRIRKLVLDGLPYWNGEQGKIIWERWFTPMYTDTTSYHVPVIALETFEEAKANDPKLRREDWETRDTMAKKSRLWWRFSQEANSGCDIASYGPSVTAPTLLLFGSGDPLRRTEEKAHKEITNSVLRVIEDCPGQVSKNLPDAMIKETIAFLKS